MKLILIRDSSPGLQPGQILGGGPLSEFRRDPISGRRVIIAPRRSDRPAFCSGGGEKERHPRPAYLGDCPFCAGNERMTPPELLSLGRDGTAPDTAGWKVRVVPNLYPAVSPAVEPFSAEGCSPAGGGAHEVVLAAPAHNRQPGNFPPRQMDLVIEACYRRGQALAGNPSLRYLQFYRNYRCEAGASLEHPHSQLIALPFVPPELRRELQRLQGLYLADGRCPFCRIVEQESHFARRIILQHDRYSALIPYAARSPFETWVLPRKHQASFLETDAPERAALADILEELLRMIARALGDPPYNYYLHTAPLRSAPLPYYHWHMELHPRISIAAGFEMGSGVFINETAPEEAARFIREKGNTDHEQSW